jgi:hypothetical protein
VDQFHEFLKNKKGDELNQKEVDLEEYIGHFEEKKIIESAQYLID